MRSRGVYNSSLSVPLIPANYKSANKLPTQQWLRQTITKPLDTKKVEGLDMMMTSKRRNKFRKPLLFNSDRDLQNSSKNISNLNKELSFLQVRFKSINQFDQAEMDSQIQQINVQKEQLNKFIANLKRIIQNNGNLLIKESEQLQKIELVSIQKDQKVYDKKMQKITKRLLSCSEQNTELQTKMQKVEEKILFYQQKYSSIINKKQEESLLEQKLKDRMQQIQQSKKKSKIQLKRLKLSYFKKLTDLKYEADGCQAIDDKINELQERINKDATYVNELNTYLSNPIQQKSQINLPKPPFSSRRRVVLTESNKEYVKQ